MEMAMDEELGWVGDHAFTGDTSTVKVARQLPCFLDIVSLLVHTAVQRHNTSIALYEPMLSCTPFISASHSLLIPCPSLAHPRI
jgi:hypothetical protein